jgi:AraC-like DNA-binding protein
MQCSSATNRGSMMIGVTTPGLNSCRNVLTSDRAAPLLRWQVRVVNEYIAANLSQRILVSDLSALVRRSRNHFARSFKKTYGMGPHYYLVCRRIERAAEMLLDNAEPLSKIALASGMCDQAHFCHVFRRMTGQTPMTWRRERNRGTSPAVAIDPMSHTNCKPESVDVEARMRVAN